MVNPVGQVQERGIRNVKAKVITLLMLLESTSSYLTYYFQFIC